ncbi:hypothetical protein OESDEN_04495 [Oesophagostomum dentatum]|uniref:Uncharacterized protein n=1 Tax=Oesophagostomum dentatum TaxID=61180 RepID=A0A0B1TDD9_OESDE|nr:hypothetical protein OESDEN_04495 [Oesophagostomum dentatum]
MVCGPVQAKFGRYGFSGRARKFSWHAGEYTLRRHGASYQLLFVDICSNTDNRHKANKSSDAP